MNKSFIKDVLSLFLITAIAGLLLGGVYEITKEPIAKQKQKQKQEAYQTVFVDADSFDVHEAADAATVLDAKGLSAEMVTIDEVMVAKKGGELVGYVVTATSHEGYGGDIQITVGITLDGKVNGISFLSIAETAGLGMKAKEPKFMDQFAGKSVDAFVVTKTGASSASEVDALTGATITSKAVVNAVNGCLYYCDSLEGGSANE